VGTGSLFLGLKQSETEAAYLNQIPGLRMSGTLFPLLHAPSWHVHGNFYFFILHRNVNISLCMIVQKACKPVKIKFSTVNALKEVKSARSSFLCG